ncbi:MAG: PKD domain-containing protein [Gemmataceae bacterium]|nr:PKD domain-containing protein [Gemmataceae bacterium]
MADEKPTGKSGWVKAGVTSMLGLFSGAALMYVSPLLNSAIKPGKPIANFSHQADGLSVTFQNRSTGANNGWWDFGDGAALEPFSPKQETITHTYARPGTYMAKLNLRNFLGDENERIVSINVDGTVANPPTIETFQVIPLKPDSNAPVTFRVVSKIKNADLCIWSLGDDRPLEISNDTQGTQDRLVTLNEAGYYTLRLVAVAGKATAEKSESVFVGMGESVTPAAMLQVTFDAVRVEKATKKVNIAVQFPADRKENSYTFDIERPIDPGFQIVDAKLERSVSDAAVKSHKLSISPDKTKIRLSGELVKQGGFLQKNAPPPSWVPTVQVTLERRALPERKTSDPVAANLNVPGSTLVPLPKLPNGWAVADRKLNLELRDGATIIYRGSVLPSGANVQIRNRACRVTATELADHVRVDVVDARVPSN